ncbi:MAG: peptidase S10, partial [Acidobacteria bacterium]|nr:peptidase S10 [Acidobacteriota bacterium]
DLVFIDPVSTGYSRAAQEKEAKEFHGFKGDIESVGEFIRLYVTRNNRWASPKYLIGESYGTTRAAELSGHLQNTLGMNLNGVALISSILNFETARFARGNDLPFILFLPTYTATAWYHKRLPAELQKQGLEKVFAESEAFAGGEYAAALMKGDSLPAAQQAEVARRVARLTGLTPEYVVESNLRLNISRFTKELLRKERRTVGRFDSRYTGTDYDAAGERPDYDPSYSIAQGPFTATLNDYLRRELKFETDLPYE